MLCFSALLALAVFAAAQTPETPNPGVANTDPNCVIAGWPFPGQVLYFSPDDTIELGQYVTTTGTCTPNSYARTTIIYPSPNLNINGNIGSQFCGWQPLNGAFSLMHCPGMIRGQVPEGTYKIISEVGPVSFNGLFQVVHSQSTTTAATPTVFFTTTPSTTTTSTIVTTNVDTVTAPPATVTKPIATGRCTITITPSRSTISVVSTKSITITKKTFSAVKAIATVTAKCKPMQPRSPHRGRLLAVRAPSPAKVLQVRQPEVTPRALVKRFDDQNGIINGDGPLTVTINPPPFTSTITADTTTFTDTATSTVSSTLTQPANPATVTVFSGTTTITVTLPTKTRTISNVVTTKITTVVGVTKTYTIRTTTTPACIPKK